MAYTEKEYIDESKFIVGDFIIEEFSTVVPAYYDADKYIWFQKLESGFRGEGMQMRKSVLVEALKKLFDEHM